MAQKHTPGPYRADSRGLMIYADGNPYGNGPMHIADIRGWGHLTGRGYGGCAMSEQDAFDIQIANANLLAASEDLLKACKAALVKICGDGLDGNYGEHEDNPLPTMLHEAIAKAEGK